MKLISQFNDFLLDHVNLNDTRVSLLEDSITAIKNIISRSAWGPNILDYKAQGSWVHKTIIKPLPNKPFDADLIVFVDPHEEWDASTYINELYQVFKGLDLYKDKVQRYSHCITIIYAGDRKIDIAPCIKDRIFLDTLEVCNRTSNVFEISNPIEYTKWLTDKNVITTNNNLRKTTRLIKYLRDIKTTFTCPSFLLTTLVGIQVHDWDMRSNTFTDVPTTLKILFGRLDDFLQMHPYKPEIRNPVLSSEIQSDSWDDARYLNFRSMIHKYREWIDDAYDEVDKEESIGKWQRVFGIEFAKQEAIQKAANISEEALSEMEIAADENVFDLVGMVKRWGKYALPKGINRLSHMRRPTWKSSKDNIKVIINAYLYTSRNSNLIRQITSLESLQAHFAIKFEAKTITNLPFPDTYKVEWRVTNTDSAATKADALRGDFYYSDYGHIRWEDSMYRGVHLVEAFLIRKFDETLVGQSEPFYVVVE